MHTFVSTLIVINAYIIVLFLPLFTLLAQDRDKGILTDQFKLVGGFYKEWDVRIFKEGCAWKQINPGTYVLWGRALLRQHACLVCLLIHFSFHSCFVNALYIQ